MFQIDFIDKIKSKTMFYILLRFVFFVYFHLFVELSNSYFLWNSSDPKGGPKKKCIYYL